MRALKAVRSSACTSPKRRTTPTARAPGVVVARCCSFASARSTTCRPVIVPPKSCNVLMLHFSCAQAAKALVSHDSAAIASEARTPLAC